MQVLVSCTCGFSECPADRLSFWFVSGPSWRSPVHPWEALTYRTAFTWVRTPTTSLCGPSPWPWPPCPCAGSCWRTGESWWRPWSDWGTSRPSGSVASPVWTTKPSPRSPPSLTLIIQYCTLLCDRQNICQGLYLILLFDLWDTKHPSLVYDRSKVLFQSLVWKF